MLHRAVKGPPAAAAFGLPWSGLGPPGGPNLRPQARVEPMQVGPRGSPSQVCTSKANSIDLFAGK